MVHKSFLESSVLFLIVFATRELHSFEPSVYGHGAGCNLAKIILMCTLQLYDPLVLPVSALSRLAAQN